MAEKGQKDTPIDLPIRRRVRSGCAKCKKSHLKCDEQKPLCTRCLRHGFECLYPLPKRSRVRDVRQILPTAVLTPPSSTSLIWPAKLGPGEVQYYDRFRNQVACAMGRQIEGPSDFWLRSVLRESSTDACILDIVVAIGALAYALDETSGSRPLFLSGTTDGSLHRHHREAIKYYTRAIAKLRSRIANPTSANLSRTILINTVLFSFFESIQGNTAAADKLVAQGILLLKDVILQNCRRQHASRIASPADDDGVMEAEFFLIRTTTWNIQYSPLHPRQEASILDITYPHPHILPPPAPSYSTREFWKTWWHIVTMAGVWNARAQSELSHHTSKESSPYLSDKMKHEHTALLSQLDAWEAAALERMSQTTEPAMTLPVQVYVGARVLRTMVYCSIDPTGAVWDDCRDKCLEILTNYRLAIDSNTPSYARSIIYDAILAGVSNITQASRDFEVRFGGLELWKRLVHRQSSWDIKSVFMGTSALIQIEEANRDAHGHIPMASRYDWTQGVWNDAYTEFEVTLTPKRGNPGSNQAAEKHITLRPVDFEFA